MPSGATAQGPRSNAGTTTGPHKYYSLVFNLCVYPYRTAESRYYSCDPPQGTSLIGGTTLGGITKRGPQPRVRRISKSAASAGTKKAVVAGSGMGVSTPRISPPPKFTVWMLKYVCSPKRPVIRAASASAAVPPLAVRNGGL
jgi:hypothetical protein